MTKQEKTAIIAAVVNLIITAIKMSLAFFTGSFVVLAETYHSLADVLTSFLIFFTLLIDRRSMANHKNEDPESIPKLRKLLAPGRWSTRFAVVLGLLLIMIAYNIIKKSWTSPPVELNYPAIAAPVMLFLALCSYLLSKFEMKVGEDTKTMALVADAHHARSDMFVSIFVAAVLIGSIYGWNLDKSGAVIVAVLILFNGIHVLIKAGKSYISQRKGQSGEDLTFYEDIIFKWLESLIKSLDCSFWYIAGKVLKTEGSKKELRGKAARLLISAIIFILVIIYMFSGFYIVGPNEQAIVERFGKPLQTVDYTVDYIEAGLHYHWPYPIEKARKVNVSELRRKLIGYAKASNDDSLILWTKFHYSREYSVFTGENYLFNIAMQVHYRISDPYQYLYSHSAPEKFVESTAYSEMRGAIGGERFFRILTSERPVLEKKIKSKMQHLMDLEKTGIVIENIYFRDIHPAREVAFAFEDVVSAQENYDEYIELAIGYEKDIIPRTRGEASRIVSRAGIYSDSAIAQSEGEAKSFLLKKNAYSEANDITVTRLALETFAEALQGVNKYIFTKETISKSPTVWYKLQGSDWLSEIPPDGEESFDEP
jgi:modulator of FtsH protease HflK